MDIVRKLLPVLLITWCCVFVINKKGVGASHQIIERLQNVKAVEVKDTHRTKFHFQPPQHWINDPNGPMFFNGFYHLFYQYNPKGSVWGNIVWAHSVSKDLISWEALEPAIYPSKPFDINGCWSGSATILPGNKPIILYTGLDPDKRQIQNYAVPKDDRDPYLREWIKPDDNPLVVPSPGMNTSQFRDPTTAWWFNGYWRIIVGSKKHHQGVAELYRSMDFKLWVKSNHPLHSAPDTGMWECPDFYPLYMNGNRQGADTSRVGPDVKHLFKVSLDETRYEYYTLGTYKPEDDRYTVDPGMKDSREGLRYDCGNFYSSKTFFDPVKSRRILWGWSNESDSADDDTKKGWAGIQAIPREVWLTPDGKQILQWPIQEVETLRGKKTDMTNQILEQGKTVEVRGITAAQADVEVTFSVPNLDKAEEYDPNWPDAQTACAAKRSNVPGGVGPFGLLTLASQNLEEFTPIFFRIFKTKEQKHKVLMCSDGKFSTLRPFDEKHYRPSFAGLVDVDIAAEKKISLRTFIDHSVVESFGAGGKTCILSRVYPTLAVNDAAHLFLFNNGTVPITVQSLTAWDMNAPKSMNQGEK